MSWTNVKIKKTNQQIQKEEITYILGDFFFFCVKVFKIPCFLWFIRHLSISYPHINVCVVNNLYCTCKHKTTIYMVFWHKSTILYTRLKNLSTDLLTLLWIILKSYPHPSMFHVKHHTLITLHSVTRNLILIIIYTYKL